MKVVSKNGFTLIELMIVVAIVAVLAMIAYPSYMDSVRKSRRADAMAALSAAQLLQEKYRANHTTYGTLANASIGATSPDGFYTITVAQSVSDRSTCAVTGSPTATAYAIKATGQKGQDNDTGCTAICVDQSGTYSPATCAQR